MSPEKVAILVVAGLIAVLLAVALLGTESTGSGATGTPEKPKAPATERVLLVEDEAVVRGVVERTLQRAGYRVVVATNGDEALELTESDGQFDLLITDILMPGLKGWELGRRLGERWPGLPVLYMSGYTEDVLTDVDTRGAAFLQKPFLPIDLLTAIRQLLDKKS